MADDDDIVIAASSLAQRLARLERPTQDRAPDIARVLPLYRALGLKEPQVEWYTGQKVLSPADADLPVRVMDRLLYNLWFKLDTIEPVVERLGYDKRENSFQLALNKARIFNQFKLKRAGGNTRARPLWTRTLDNMISRFDAIPLVLFDVARQRGVAIDPRVAEIARLIDYLLQDVFAVLMFERWCLVFPSPTRVRLNVMHALSSDSGPAYEDAFDKLYAINGTAFPLLSFEMLPMLNRQRREALITYRGWDAFFNATPSGNKWMIQRDRFGELWEILCGAQVFTVVRVTNATREPDGSYRRYVLPVDRNCRPLPDPTDPLRRPGPRQERTALNAVASTFGMTGDEYRRILVAQS
jgi:hypothetical protein